MVTAVHVEDKGWDSGFNKVIIEGVQNRPLQNVLVWHVDYFEQNTIEILWAQEKILPLLKNSNWGPCP